MDSLFFSLFSILLAFIGNVSGAQMAGSGVEFSRRESSDPTQGMGKEDDILMRLQLGEHKYQLIKQTLRNEVNLYNNLKTFPKRTYNADKYIQLYMICSYLSLILSCDAFKAQKTDQQSLRQNSNSTHDKTTSEIDFQVNNFPWTNEENNYVWSVQSGSYGSVICGELNGGERQIFPKSNINVNSFFLGTYKSLSSPGIELSAVIPSFGKRLEYKKLDKNKKQGVCVKTFGLSFNKEYYNIWKRENFNLKWLERETWVLVKHYNANHSHLYFTPKQMYISKRTRGSKERKFRINRPLSENALRVGRDNNQCSLYDNHLDNEMFSANVFETIYPWNVYGRYWSSFLLMERFWGPSITDISNYLLRSDVINWTKLSIFNEYIWSVSIVKLVHLFFHALVMFSFSGKLIYQHCDLHSNNIIFLSENWKPGNSEDNYYIPIQDEKPVNDELNSKEGTKTESSNFNSKIKEEILTEIIKSGVGKVKMIDLTFVANIDMRTRRRNDFCFTYGEVSISDIDNWTIFTYELVLRIKKVFETHSISSIRTNPLDSLVNKIQGNKKFESSRPKFIGESEFWWRSWEINNEITFDESYESIIEFGTYFSEAINDLHSEFTHKLRLNYPDKGLVNMKAYFPNPITLDIYMRNVFYVPRKILLFINCLLKFYRPDGNINTYFQLATKVIVNYFASQFNYLEGLPPKWFISEGTNKTHSFFKRCKANSIEGAFELPTNYQEPCFDKYCLVQKPFPDYIQEWIKCSEDDDERFIQISKELINRATSGIHLSLSILLAYQYEREVLINCNEQTELENHNTTRVYRTYCSKLVASLPSFAKLNYCVKDDSRDCTNNSSTSNNEFFDLIVNVSATLQSLYVDEELSESSCVKAFEDIMGASQAKFQNELQKEVCSNILNFVYLKL